MRKLFLFILPFVVNACLRNPETFIAEIPKFDFSQYASYSLGVYRTYGYFVEYNGYLYVATMPLDTNAIIDLRRHYTEEESRNLGLVLGKDRFVEDIPLDTDIAKELTAICLLFREIWLLDPKHFRLNDLIVDKDHNVEIIIERNQDGAYFRVLYSNDIGRMLTKVEDEEQMDEYHFLQTNLCYRELLRDD
ncbi:MAG: hypothetical protein IJU63_03450 [Bacteroidales bacterium]|nr:hypothetical protein [Bacteroidales bacterium]